MDSRNELRITCEVGILVKGRIINAIKSYCFRRGLIYSIEEGFGILSKPLFIKIYAPKSDWDRITKDMDSIFE